MITPPIATNRKLKRLKRKVQEHPNQPSAQLLRTYRIERCILRCSMPTALKKTWLVLSVFSKKGKILWLLPLLGREFNYKIKEYFYKKRLMEENLRYTLLKHKHIGKNRCSISWPSGFSQSMKGSTFYKNNKSLKK